MWKNCGRSRGECDGVARGVWSGVGEIDSWENDGEGGAVDCGEAGLDFFVMRCAYWSSSSCECERDMGCDVGFDE